MENGRKGFEIAFDIRRSIVRVRVWGQWDRGFVHKFGNAFKERIRTICHDNRECAVLIDFRDYVTEDRIISEMLYQHISAVEHYGIKKVGCLQERSDRDGIARCFSEAGKTAQYAWFTAEEQALEWLMISPLSADAITGASALQPGPENQEVYDEHPCRRR